MACTEILTATGQRYAAAPYQVGCVTESCGPEVCTRGGCIGPGDTACDVDCYACRDTIVCDVLSDRLATLVNLTSTPAYSAAAPSAYAYAKPVHDLSASVLWQLTAACQSSGAGGARAAVSQSPVWRVLASLAVVAAFAFR